MQNVVFHIQEMNSGSAIIKVSGNAHCQVPFYASINKLEGTGPLWQPVTIETLPDGPLLEMFSLYVEEAYEACDLDGVFGIKQLEAWCTLVHVCQRWRTLVFASPRRLNLRLVCTSGTPVREMLNIWPTTLPIVVHARFEGIRSLTGMGKDWKNADSFIVALKHRDRVCEIGFWSPPLDQLPAFVEILQGSFPALTRLHLCTEWFEFPVLHPDSFLGGSAPRLRSLTLDGIRFPELPKLLLSSRDLVELRLRDIPHSGYISPEAIATCLSSLTSLKKLSLTFVSPQSLLDEASRHLPASACVDIPGLVQLELHGVNDYMEDLVSRINAPRLTHVIISFFGDRQFDISQFGQFIRRVQNFQVLHRVRVKLDDSEGDLRAQFILFADPTDGTTLGFSFSGIELESEHPSLAVLSTSSLSPFRLSSFERLELWNAYSPPGYWETAIQNTQWSKRFQQFTAVKDLYLEDELAIPVARTLRHLTGKRATEMLPALQNIFIKRSIGFFEGDTESFSRGNVPLGVVLQEIEPFIVTRQLSSCPVAVQYWN